ncbi:hypothetical protein FPZ42_00510 [Mucilaginibacter achroorhodeus]|uniref:Uncharacterized protein n=1 Tax=Mucilaginibacter achroorhodeus TaxID=2599294 RepID=A0A563U8R1_9SPHI|nr:MULTISPECIES: hypothetical protein [Mucilaginibacter]QXV67303.1 hypothetical protein INP83_09520 [Mucilaginibacter sp. 21P]TWR27728.1 hypothetical protein FPZ42_00510 [Mucilaginibacter achroorhodeus]
MNDYFTSPTAIFFYFLVAGSTLVYFILLFDKKNRQKLSKILVEAQGTQPMLMKKAAEHKMRALKAAVNDRRFDHSQVEKQLDKLVADYDKGLISLPDYCHSLNHLIAMTA